MPIQASYCANVRIPKSGCYPNTDLGLQTGGIGDKLTQMSWIRMSQLILDDNKIIGSSDARNDIGPIRPDPLLRFLQIQIKAQHTGQLV